MDAIGMLQTAVTGARQVVGGTIADVTQDQCDTSPGGKAHPIGATYAHIIMSEDFIVNMIVRGQSPLAMGEWAGKTGVSEPPPPPGPGVYEWAQRVKVDVPAMGDYAKAVYKATDDYIASLTPEDLDRELDVPGMGKNSVAFWLGLATTIHPSNHIGEISAMKGIQGAQGYPF